MGSGLAWDQIMWGFISHDENCGFYFVMESCWKVLLRGIT